MPPEDWLISQLPLLVPELPKQGGVHTDASCLHTGLAWLPYLVMRFMGF